MMDIENTPDENSSKSPGKTQGGSDDINNDPYAYLNREEFTSEKFKIEIRGLPKYYGVKELKKLLNNKLKLNTTKIKMPGARSNWIYVCFKSDEDKAKAINVLNGYEWKNTRLRAEEAKPIPDPLVQKRIQNINDSGPESKKVKLEPADISRQIKNATTPWWEMPYEEQVQKKKLIISGILIKLGYELKKVNSNLSKWWFQQKSKYNGLSCDLLPLSHASNTKGYRNRCEFTIGINDNTGEKTIGFRVSTYVAGSVSVGPIDDALNVPEKMKVAVRAFQDFVRESSLDVFNPESHKGYWRQLAVRYGFKTNELMLVVGIDPQQLTVLELEELKNKIKEFFTEGEGKSCHVSSLYLTQMRRKKSQNDAFMYDHILGETHITEKLLGKTFRISPQSFFQVNTNAAEILYEHIGELAGLTSDVTLLDVYCGTGSIGICLSDKCGEVFGLELAPEAIEDAKLNAAVNNVSNAEFFVGKAEEILSSVAYKATKEDIVAVVDPPRAGLQQEALIQLRKMTKIKRLVYVACDPKKALKNFIDLGREPSKVYKGEPFLPVKAIPVDLFPQTPHCELLVYFERRLCSCSYILWKIINIVLRVLKLKMCHISSECR